jgi:hypothetical protein
MKKKIFGGIAVLAIAAVAAINVNFNSQNNDLANISLANVEALAGCEDTVTTRGNIIIVTVCNRKTSFTGTLIGISCGSTATVSCQFTNVRG